MPRLQNNESEFFYSGKRFTVEMSARLKVKNFALKNKNEVKTK